MQTGKRSSVTYRESFEPSGARASPLLVAEFLMSLAAFVSLEDIATELPPYTGEVVGVPMDASLQAAYKALEEDVKNTIKQHRTNHSVLSVGTNALLLYPDHACGLGIASKAIAAVRKISNSRAGGKRFIGHLQGIRQHESRSGDI